GINAYQQVNHPDRLTAPLMRRRASPRPTSARTAPGVDVTVGGASLAEAADRLGTRGRQARTGAASSTTCGRGAPLRYRTTVTSSPRAK
ncbi:hypothetical protein ACWD95_35325, partial [Streptomyces sp. NPDC005069]